MAKFSDRLALLRKGQGYTQKEVSEKIGVKHSTYVGWESEGKTPDTVIICKIAEMYKVSCDYLLGYSDYKESMQAALPHASDNLTMTLDVLPSNDKETASELIKKMYDFIFTELKDAERMKVYISFLDMLSKSRTAIHKDILEHDISGLIGELSETKKSFSDIVDKLVKLDIKAKGENKT